MLQTRRIKLILWRGLDYINILHTQDINVGHYSPLFTGDSASVNKRFTERCEVSSASSD